MVGSLHVSGVKGDAMAHSTDMKRTDHAMHSRVRSAMAVPGVACPVATPDARAGAAG